VTDLSTFTDLVPLDHGLVTIVCVRADGSPQTSVVNAGVLPSPLVDGGPDVVGFVAAGGSHKLRLLRADPRIAVTIRAGWQWASVEGSATLVGPDDPHPGVDAERLRLLLRDVFTAAGGTHDDWDDYDRVMRDERRCVVLVTPTRVYSNPT
jgi:PPOX class probable F420-dependent enzyme